VATATVAVGKMQNCRMQNGHSGKVLWNGG